MARSENLGRQPYNDLIRKDGRTGAWVAQQIGVTYSHFMTVAQGKVAPAPEFRERLSAFMGVPESELFTPAALAVEYNRKCNSHVLTEDAS